VKISSNVVRVVIGHEVEVKHLTVDCENGTGEEQINPEVTAQTGRLARL
jgi:hypothetical protein